MQSASNPTNRLQPGDSIGEVINPSRAPNQTSDTRPQDQASRIDAFNRQQVQQQQVDSLFSDKWSDYTSPAQERNVLKDKNILSAMEKVQQREAGGVTIT